MRIKGLLLDGVSNYLFFVPLVILVSGVPSKWTLDQTITYTLTAIPISMIGGLIYGRFINWWRRKFKYQ